jgi:hypothetical protein
MTIQRVENVGIVVEDIEAATAEMVAAMVVGKVALMLWWRRAEYVH